MSIQWKRGLRSLVIVMVAVHAILFFMQRELMYPRHVANRTPWQTPEQVEALGFTETRLVTSDGVALALWYRPARKGRPTILFFHGNAITVSRMSGSLKQWAAAGYGVAALSYRGYGISEGEPTEEGLYNDARAAHAFLREQNVTDDQIVLHGRSLGTGIAMQLATEMTPRAVILVSPFTSMPDMAAYAYPWLLAGRWLTLDRYDSLSKAAKIHAPVLVMHGDQDALVPLEMGRTLFEALPEPKRFVVLEGADHIRMPAQKMMAEVDAFLSGAAFPK